MDEHHNLLFYICCNAEMYLLSIDSGLLWVESRWRPSVGFVGTASQ